MLISIVVPAYNEAEGVNTFHKDHLMPSLRKLSGKYEVIYVNDGSKDGTLGKLAAIAKKDGNVKVINLSRNFGKEIATTAGLFNTTGDATIVMDADGQHPPESISDFVNKWKGGAQVVIGVRKSNQEEGFVKKWGSKVFYKLFNSTSGVEMVPRSTDFRLIDKVVVQEFKNFGERNRITRGLIDWLGFKREFIYFDSPARLAGEASYKASQLFKLAINSFVSLSLKPLVYLGVLGLFISLLSLVAGLFIFVEQVLLGDPLALNFTGTAMLGIFISFLVGLIIIAQGVVAIYMSHIHTQSQARPLFVVDHSTSYGLPEKDEE